MGLLGGGNKASEANILLSQDKADVYQRLTQDLLETKEENERLREENRVAIGGRKGAVQQVRDLEDVLRLKEQLAEDMERQLDFSEARSESLGESVKKLEAELGAIRLEQAEFPLSDMDLLHRHNQKAELFESIQEALTCPVCYEFFGRDAAVSLLCGHTFCNPCFKEWETRQMDAFKLSTIQGAWNGAECPECRSTDVRRGRVRIWALEEVVRLVERGTRDLKVLYKPPLQAPPVEPSPPPAKATNIPATSASQPDREASEASGDQMEVDEEIPRGDLEDEGISTETVSATTEEEESLSSIIRPRTSTPYAGYSSGR